MTHTHADLDHRLAALRADFAALGSRAAGAAQALAATLPPPTSLLDELTVARQAFHELRGAMLAHAGELSVVLDAEELATLRDLEPVLAAIAAAERRRQLLAAWEAARAEAFSVLDRVLALVHHEEKAFAPLADGQARARELRAALAASTPDDPEHETTRLPERLQPYTDLLALVEGWTVLDDERCASLQDAITRAFGRALGLAALRGKLGREGERPAPVTAPPPRPRMSAPAPPPAEPALQAANTPVPPAPAPVVAAPAPPLPPPAPAPPAVAPVAEAVAAAGVSAPAAPSGGVVSAAGGGRMGAPAAATGASLVVEIRQSGDAVSVETPEARREREALLERLAGESARWWIGARAGWQAMQEGAAGMAAAAREYLRRFPYLLSVPLPRSAEYAEGRLAEGYALLLAHIEKQEAGFVQDALTRLNPQFAGRPADETYPLGQELYLYVVAEGRLYKTYPDFVREVMLHTVPEPGPWVQGGIEESDEATRLFTRSARPGSVEEQSRVLTEPRERAGPHVFRVTVAPLTTRFFTLRPATAALADPPGVEIRLLNNDAPSDHAWLVTLPVAGATSPSAPRKHRTGGTKLPELGKELGGLWVGVFNADPTDDHRYDLSIALRRKPAATPAAKAAPSTERFFGRKR